MSITCDIQNGRLLDDCLESQAGIQTIFFFKHNQLKVEKNLAGEIISIGVGTVYRFEQDDSHGVALQEIIRGDADTQYLRQQVDLTLFYITPEYLQTVNYLKRGHWAILFLDYDNRLRLLGEYTPMTQVKMLNQSGTAAGDKKWSNLSFMGITSDFAPFLEDYANFPFDNLPGIDVIPPYGPPIPTEPTLELDDTTDFFRLNVRSGKMNLDQVRQPPGFDGNKPADWDTIDTWQ